jgi:hypothetical protein
LPYIYSKVTPLCERQIVEQQLKIHDDLQWVMVGCLVATIVIVVVVEFAAIPIVVSAFTIAENVSDAADVVEGVSKIASGDESGAVDLGMVILPLGLGKRIFK